MKNNNPQWLENAVFYEIYPQSYKDTNADGIGDLTGMTESLHQRKVIQSMDLSRLHCNLYF